MTYAELLTRLTLASVDAGADGGYPGPEVIFDDAEAHAQARFRHVKSITGHDGRVVIVLEGLG